MRAKLPSISVVMPALNSQRTLEKCLKAIRGQNYPQSKIEILIVDGGSTDKTPQIAKKYKCRFIEGGYRDNMEARRGLGLSLAKNELYVVIDTDNILVGKNYFREVVQPFLDHPDLTAAQTWKYSVRKRASMFNRYCALLGANDPVAFYLKKSERLSWAQDSWELGEVLEDNKGYLLVDFNEDNLPTFGCNGFIVKRKLLLKTKCKPKDYFHIDVVMDLVRKGHTKIAMVKNELFHDTAAKLSTLAKKRISYFTEHHPLYSNRRYLLFRPGYLQDWINLILFIFFTLTFIEPIIFSIRGYLKKKDLAWFLHPIVCWVFLFAYGVATIKVYLREKLTKFKL